MKNEIRMLPRLYYKLSEKDIIINYISDPERIATKNVQSDYLETTKNTDWYRQCAESDICRAKLRSEAQSFRVQSFR